MFEIRIGLRENLDVSFYAKPELSWKQMLKIKLELLKERKNKENEQNIQQLKHRKLNKNRLD